jgi:hypothetical protein
MRLRTLLGDYPVTHALRTGQIRSDKLSLLFDDVKLPQNAFKRLVNGLEFDIAEIAVVTFLLAKAHGRPYRLLLAVVMARSPYPYLVHNTEKGDSVPPEVSDEFLSFLEKSRAVAGCPDMAPFGLEQNRRNLEVAIDSVFRQDLIPRRFAVEELFK